MKKYNLLYIALAVLFVGSIVLGACAPSQPALGTEQNPITWAVVPSNETKRVVTGFTDVANLIKQETGQPPCRH